MTFLEFCNRYFDFGRDLPDVPEGEPKLISRIGLNKDRENVETLLIELPMPVKVGGRKTGRYVRKYPELWFPDPEASSSGKYNPDSQIPRWVHGVQVFGGFKRGDSLECALSIEVWIHPTGPGLWMFRTGPHKEVHLTMYDAYQRAMFPWPVLGHGISLTMTAAAAKNIRGRCEAGAHFGVILFNSLTEE